MSIKRTVVIRKKEASLDMRPSFEEYGHTSFLANSNSLLHGHASFLAGHVSYAMNKLPFSEKTNETWNVLRWLNLVHAQPLMRNEKEACPWYSELLFAKKTYVQILRKKDACPSKPKFRTPNSIFKTFLQEALNRKLDNSFWV